MNIVAKNNIFSLFNFFFTLTTILFGLVFTLFDKIFKLLPSKTDVQGLLIACLSGIFPECDSHVCIKIIRLSIFLSKLDWPDSYVWWILDSEALKNCDILQNSRRSIIWRYLKIQNWRIKKKVKIVVFGFLRLLSLNFMPDFENFRIQKI